jgi:Concanavalin A-like lectin/glucanases superfamily/Domain of unknown function (DUF2341)
MTWYSSSWKNRNQVTVNAAHVPASLNNYSVYIDLSLMGSNFFTKVQNGGADIRITQSDGVTECPIEICSCNTSTNTGEMYFKAPNITNASNTSFYIYYGNSTAAAYSPTATYGAQAVWGNGQSGVWHLNEAVGATQILDSTANGNNSSAIQGSPTLGATGKLGTCITFNGSNRILIPYNTSMQPTAAVAFSFWMNSGTQINGYAKPVWYGDNSTGPWYGVYGIQYDSGHTNINANVSSGTAQHMTPVYANPSGWHLIAGTYDGTDVNLYDNGALVEQLAWATGTIGTYNTVGLGIGDKYQTGQGFVGSIDEVRLYSINHSANWFLADYNNQNSASTFLTIGVQEIFMLTRINIT